MNNGDSKKTQSMYTVTVNNPSNGRIKLMINNNGNETEANTNPILLSEGTLICGVWDGDKPNGLRINADKWTKVESDITVEAYPSSDKDEQFLMTLLQKPNQLIIAYGVKKNENGDIVYTGERHIKSFFATNGSMWRFTVIPNKSLGKYYLNIVQSNHQVIIVRADTSIKDYRAGVLVSYNTDDTKEFKPDKFNDKYEYTVNNINCRIFATLPYDVNESISRNVSVNIIKIPHQTITLYDENNIPYVESAELRRNSKYKVEVKPDKGYTASNIIINNVNTGMSVYNGTANTPTITISCTDAVPSSVSFSIIPSIFDPSVDSTSNYDDKVSLCVTSTKTDEIEAFKSADVFTYKIHKPIPELTNNFGMGRNTNDITYSNSTYNEKEVHNKTIILSPSDKIVYNVTKYVDNKVHKFMDKELIVGYVYGLDNSKILPMMPTIYIGRNNEYSGALFGIYYSFENDSNTLDDIPKIKSNTKSYWNVAISNYSDTKDNPDIGVLGAIPSGKMRLYFYKDSQMRYLIDTIENFVFLKKIKNIVNDKPYSVYLYQTVERKNPFDPAYIHMMRCLQNNKDTSNESDKMMLYCRLAILK